MHLRNQLTTHEAAWRDWFAKRGIAPLTLAYEDFADDLGTAVWAVIDHVGIEAPETLDVGVPMRRQSDALTDEWLQRFAREAA